LTEKKYPHRLIGVIVSKRTNIKKQGAKLFFLIAGLTEFSDLYRVSFFQEQWKHCSIGSKKSEGGTHRVTRVLGSYTLWSWCGFFV
jgi:hypothetical protein